MKKVLLLMACGILIFSKVSLSVEGVTLTDQVAILEQAVKGFKQAGRRIEDLKSKGKLSAKEERELKMLIKMRERAAQFMIKK